MAENNTYIKFFLTGFCIAHGQFHYSTFDGKLFSFNGPCGYTMLKIPGKIEVTVENIQCRDTGVVCAKQIKIMINETTVVTLTPEADLMIGSSKYPDYKYRYIHNNLYSETTQGK